MADNVGAVCKHSAEAYDAVYLDRRADFLLQIVKNCSRCHIFTFIFIVCRGKIFIKILLDGCDNGKLCVVLHQQFGLNIIEICFFVMFQGVKGLCKELSVIGFHAHIDGGCQLHADEAAVARRVGENVGEIARCDERRQSWKLLHAGAIRTFHLDTWQLDDVFQKSLLHGGRNLIELVEVDEQELRHSLQNLPLF